MNPEINIKCNICGSTENLTKDHIVPKKFIQRMRGIGIRLDSRLQTLCFSCNQKKASHIDWKDPRVREIMKDIGQKLISKVDKYDN